MRSIFPFPISLEETNEIHLWEVEHPIFYDDLDCIECREVFGSLKEFLDEYILFSDNKLFIVCWDCLKLEKEENAEYGIDADDQYFLLSLLFLDPTVSSSDALSMAIVCMKESEEQEVKKFLNEQLGYLINVIWKGIKLIP